MTREDRARNRENGEKFQQTTGAGTDAFYPNFWQHFRDERCQKVSAFLQVVEVTGKGRITASCTMFCFFALPATQIRGWEWVRAGTMDNWRGTLPAEWSSKGDSVRSDVEDRAIRSICKSKEPRSSRNAH